MPAFLAAELGSGQALGLVGVRAGANGTLRVVRRLDGGRREVLDAPPGTVLSVEGAAASLRRASLPAELAAAACHHRGADGTAGSPRADR